jgi:hypothetical protein
LRYIIGHFIEFVKSKKILMGYWGDGVMGEWNVGMMG